MSIQYKCVVNLILFFLMTSSCKHQTSQATGTSLPENHSIGLTSSVPSTQNIESITIGQASSNSSNSKFVVVSNPSFSTLEAIGADVGANYDALQTAYGLGSKKLMDDDWDPIPLSIKIPLANAN